MKSNRSLTSLLLVIVSQYSSVSPGYPVYDWDGPEPNRAQLEPDRQASRRDGGVVGVLAAHPSVEVSIPAEAESPVSPDSARYWNHISPVSFRMTSKVISWESPSSVISYHSTTNCWFGDTPRVW